jgi:UDP-2,3-diacylglucosamine hydrolase
MAHGRILFVSDLHLDASAPETIALFLDFLRTEASTCDGLYILGDLFETWVGDDDDEPARLGVCAALRELTAGGVPCFIQHGNRDFLLGPRFMAASGCELLPDPRTLEIAGRRFVLTHGDQLCTEDHRYQRFRRLARNGVVQTLWRALPLAFRRRIAAALRRSSHAYTRQLPESIMDVAPAAVTSLLRATRCDVLVHGHTHRPAVHAMDLDGTVRTRIVLGDWPTRATTLIMDARGQFVVRGLPAGKPG